ncbi:hypothetical protein HDV05_007707 [Chytridiales sp. JEL 0842]|nr:hypothetical protein HDV05_007707 [Chytridiales sp. JEL 0842]
MKLPFIRLLALLIALVAITFSSSATAQDGQIVTGSAVLKKYIIMLKESTTDSAVSSFIDKVKGLGGEVVREYKILKGFTITLPSNLVSTLENEEDVDVIEEDSEVRAYTGDPEAL